MIPMVSMNPRVESTASGFGLTLKEGTVDSCQRSLTISHPSGRVPKCALLCRCLGAVYVTFEHLITPFNLL